MTQGHIFHDEGLSAPFSEVCVCVYKEGVGIQWWEGGWP